MAEHNFREHRFVADGELNGFKTAVQESICRNCGLIIELPLGVSHKEYHYDECKGKGVSTPVNRFNVSGGRVSQDNSMLLGNISGKNRHEVRGLRAKEALLSSTGDKQFL